VNVQATSSYDAAHLYVVEAKKKRAAGLPKPTLATVFEVVTAGEGVSRDRRRLETLEARMVTFVIESILGQLGVTFGRLLAAATLLQCGVQAQ
jgi:hypothetical protein